MNLGFNKSIRLLLVVLLLLCLSSCSCNNDNFKITGSSVVNIGSSINLSCKLDSNEINSEDVNWSSSDEDIAMVANGCVTGIKSGKVVIRAFYEKMTAQFEVNVVEERKVLKSPSIISEQIIKGEKTELALFETNEGYIEENYNPYDYNEIYVFGVFNSPTNNELIMPAFWYRDYTITLDTTYTSTNGVSGTASTSKDEPQGLELVKWANSFSHYRLRITFNEIGKWNYSINVQINGIVVQAISGEISVNDSEQSNNRGIISVDKTTNRNFIDGNGNTFIPVGVNLCWWTSSSRKTYDYDVWFEKLSKSNGNMCRIWMATWGFCLHWGSKYNNFDDRLNMAARLDKVIDLADKYDIYVELTLLNHGQFSSKVNAEWGYNPYNTKNGGIISKPEYFFSNEECKKAYKNELLYIIARYGYSDKIMAWELFNEVNWTDNADTTNRLNIYTWHKEMSEFINKNDPYNHMVTTSYNSNTGMAYRIDTIDFVNPHDYGYRGLNINEVLPNKIEDVFDTYNKPVLQSEIGINYENGYETYLSDKTGASIRQSLWAGMMGGGAGGAMQWWWDSWIHPNDLYYQFEGAGTFAKMMDLTGSTYSQLRTNGNASFSNDEVNILGLQYDNRVYGYIYNTKWIYSQTSVSDINTKLTLKMNNGNYTITFYNATSGKSISASDLNVTGGKCVINVPIFSQDIAFIIQ